MARKTRNAEGKTLMMSMRPHLSRKGLHDDEDGVDRLRRLPWGRKGAGSTMATKPDGERSSHQGGTVAAEAHAGHQSPSHPAQCRK